MKNILKVGDRVRVADVHRSKPGRVGEIIEIQERTGNRYVVRFDKAEIGFYRELGSFPPKLLRLGEIDLEPYND